MTAFSANDIPAEIDTVEKLEVWCSTLLSNLYPNLTAVESTGSAVRVVTSGPFFITASDPSTWRTISRASIALSNEWQGGGNQIWAYAQPFGNLAIPASFKS
jgi:hypothetical protein